MFSGLTDYQIAGFWVSVLIVSAVCIILPLIEALKCFNGIDAIKHSTYDKNIDMEATETEKDKKEYHYTLNSDTENIRFRVFAEIEEKTLKEIEKDFQEIESKYNKLTTTTHDNDVLKQIRNKKNQEIRNIIKKHSEVL